MWKTTALVTAAALSGALVASLSHVSADALPGWDRDTTREFIRTQEGQQRVLEELVRTQERQTRALQDIGRQLERCGR
jgi:Spy/CpxP family protein refolding chaperone